MWECDSYLHTFIHSWKNCAYKSQYYGYTKQLPILFRLFITVCIHTYVVSYIHTYTKCECRLHGRKGSGHLSYPLLPPIASSRVDRSSQRYALMHTYIQCIHIYIHIYIHTYIHTCIHTCVTILQHVFCRCSGTFRSEQCSSPGIIHTLDSSIEKYGSMYVCMYVCMYSMYTNICLVISYFSLLLFSETAAKAFADLKAMNSDGSVPWGWFTVCMYVCMYVYDSCVLYVLYLCIFKSTNKFES